MKELRITDAELQRLVGTALRLYLERRGFKMASSSAGARGGYYVFPVNLGLADRVEVERYGDGTWAIRQQDEAIAARLDDAVLIHGEAILASARPRMRGGV